MLPTSEDFREEIDRRLKDAEQIGRSSIDIHAGDVHRRLGGYPARNHRMPVCCEVMRSLMKLGDEIVEEPPSGQGANFVVRYKLPREP